MRKITILFMLWVIVIFSVFACAPKATGQWDGVLKKEFNAIFDELGATQGELQEAKEEIRATKNELSETKNKLSSTENTLTDKLTNIKELKSKLAETDIEQDKYLSQYEELSIQYEELKEQHEELKEQYDANVKGTTEINGEDVEQELFRLVNQERKNNGLSELTWNDGLYSCANANNQKMSETKSLVSPECPSFQQVFWFLGYGTSDRIANVALLAWKNNSYSYKQNVLNSNAVNGAVAVYKSEEILYITFLCYTDIPFR